MTEYDVAILGAGPGGMSLAITASNHGLRVVVLDEQQTPGGQIYRNITKSSDLQRGILGQEYAEGAKLVERFKHCSAEYLPKSKIWDVTHDCRVSFSKEGKAEVIKANKLVIAMGAFERPLPIEGWTLPGVMTAGAGQILIKSSQLVPKKAILAGSGPLLYLVAAQLVRAGAPPLALVDCITMQHYWSALPNLSGALKGGKGILKGLCLLREIASAGVKRFTGAHDLKVLGKDKAEGITFKSGGKIHSMACETLLLHQGIVPNTQTSRLLNLTHQWHDQQQCFTPQLNEWFQSSNQSIYIVGDNASIAGANAAELAGELAGLDIAHSMHKIDESTKFRRSAIPRKRYQRELAFRRFLDKLYKPLLEHIRPKSEVIICRCEEITAEKVRSAAALRCAGVNQVKAFCRTGMGPCQGRYCGLTVTSLFCEVTGQTENEAGYFNIRPPIRPVTLDELAQRDDSKTEI